MKMAIKGTWSHFYFHLVSTKMKWKALKTLCHGCDKYEKESNETWDHFMIV